MILSNRPFKTKAEIIRTYKSFNRKNPSDLQEAGSALSEERGYTLANEKPDAL